MRPLIARSLCVILAAFCQGCTSEPNRLRLFVPGPNSPIAVGAQPSAPGVADFNNDGRPDIALTCVSGRDRPAGGILLLLNDGAARFTPGPEGRIDVGEPLTELAAADFNGDRYADVAAMGHDSYRVHLLLGDGKGRLSNAPGSPFPAHNGSRPHTHAVVAADVNADGNADLLTTNADDNAISVLLNDGRAKFAPAPGSPFAAPGHPYSSLAVCDLNGDGRVDVAAPHLLSGQIGVYLGDGSGRFAPAPGAPYSVAARPGFVHADDLNQDGKPDLLATHDDVGMVDVFLNEGSGRFRLAEGSPVAIERQVWGVISDDFDGDRKLDVILTAAPGRRLVLLLGDGRGGFKQSNRPELTVGESPNRMVLTDLDGDGDRDILTTNLESSDVSVLLRR